MKIPYLHYFIYYFHFRKYLVAIIRSKAETVKLAMSNLEQTKAAILSLPSNEFEQLKKWLFDLDYERWDEQLEQDIAEGKLEALAQEAIAEFEAGHCREI